VNNCTGFLVTRRLLRAAAILLVPLSAVPLYALNAEIVALTEGR